MSAFQKLSRHFRFPWRSNKQIAAEVDEELQFHVDMRVEQLTRVGMDPQAAEALAIHEFGDLNAVRRGLREADERMEREHERRLWLGDLSQDIRFALRQLHRDPVFTLVASLTFAVAIGAATALFTVIDRVLLKPLPILKQDEVVVLRKTAPAGPIGHLPVFTAELTAFQEYTRTFESVAGVSFLGASELALRDRGHLLTAHGTWVSGDYFPVLGMKPALGRMLQPSDDVPGAEPVMVVGYGFWQRHYGGDPAAVGRVLEWDGTSFRVVGVLPRGFSFPKDTELWMPVSTAVPRQATRYAYDIIGRLRPGVSADAGRQDYETFLKDTYEGLSVGSGEMTPVATPLHEVITGDSRAILWTTAAAVVLLLLIACVNVANLLLVRGSARIQELAIRSALGAGKRRLIRQLITETGVVALLGGAFGIAFAHAAVRALVLLAPAELPRRDVIEMDALVLLFAVGITVFVALLSGLLPAIVSAAGDLSVWLRSGSRAASASRGIQALRHALVIGQVSLAVLVVVSAGLLVRSLLALHSVDLGFNEERLLVLQTALPQINERFPERSQQMALWEELLARVSAIPGVVSAAPLALRPFTASGGSTAFYTGEGQAPGVQATNPLVNVELVGADYFRTMEIPIRRGRPFSVSDREDAPRVAIVSEAVARHTWPGDDPIGQRIKLGAPDARTEWHIVVGVVAETRYRELANPQPTLYLPTEQFGPMLMSLAVRTRTDPAELVPQIRYALQQAHPDWMLMSGGPLRQLMAAPLARPRFSTLLLGTFAAITLLLAAVGIYGVMASTVRQRTREIGIRLVLGATVKEVRTLILRQGLWLGLYGCAIGIAAAFFGTRVLRSLLFETSPTDRVTFVAVGAIILGATALACYIPARRATRVDPVHALRAE